MQLQLLAALLSLAATSASPILDKRDISSCAIWAGALANSAMAAPGRIMIDYQVRGPQTHHLPGLQITTTARNLNTDTQYLDFSIFNGGSVPREIVVSMYDSLHAPERLPQFQLDKKVALRTYQDLVHTKKHPSGGVLQFCVPVYSTDRNREYGMTIGFVKPH